MARITNDNMHRLNIRLPIETKDFVLAQAQSMGLSMSQMITFIVMNYQKQSENSEVFKLLSTFARDDEMKKLNLEVMEFIKQGGMKQFEKIAELLEDETKVEQIKQLEGLTELKTDI